RSADRELVELLLARGARLERSSALVTRAVEGADLAILERLLAASPPWYQRIWALKACSELDRPEMARVLVAQAERAQLLGPALDDAVRMHRSRELLEIL